ncbi:MAG: LysR family transcriptional regulator [Desulfitobacteriaceae bacterium]|nr:LysR family transcriptional regulator [Desulfitobacteriaceae bacterium]MDI6914074.1 LysR family transcriptional regulator [Desulfitobacteriaceae bacterium]
MLIESLKVFITVIEQKGFSRAADELFLSQPSVSLHIRNLENEFGTKLIHRSPKHLELTTSGRILYDRAQEMLILYEDAREKINDMRHVVTGTLKIGASFTIGEYILPRFLAEVASEYPNVDVQVTIANTEEISQALRQNQLNIGLVEGTINETGLEVEPFMQDEMILILANTHPLAGLTKVTPADLQDQVWILRESGSGTRAFSEQTILELGIQMKRSFVFSSSEGVKEAVIHGLGIAIISRLVVRKELVSGELISLPIRARQKHFVRQLSIVHRKEPSGSKALEEFLKKLRVLEKRFYVASSLRNSMNS